MAISVSSKEASRDSLLRGGVCKGAFYLKRCCQCQHGGIVSSNVKSFFLRERWKMMENQLLSHFRKKNKKVKVSINDPFPSTLVTLWWFWSPRAWLSSMVSFLPVRGLYLRAFHTQAGRAHGGSWVLSEKICIQVTHLPPVHVLQICEPWFPGVLIWVKFCTRHTRVVGELKTIAFEDGSQNVSWQLMSLWRVRWKVGGGTQKQSCRDLIARRLENSVARWWQSGEGTEVHWYEPRKDNPRG